MQIMGVAREVATQGYSGGGKHKRLGSVGVEWLHSVFAHYVIIANFQKLEMVIRS